MGHLILYLKFRVIPKKSENCNLKLKSLLLFFGKVSWLRFIKDLTGSIYTFHSFCTNRTKDITNLYVYINIGGTWMRYGLPSTISPSENDHTKNNWQ